MDYFRRLGAEVERRWLEVDRDDEAFPTIAQAALAALPPSEHFEREAFLDHELDPLAPARRERAPLGVFGQPGATVYFGREFVIEVYFWVECISGVHDHPFKGIFTILEGESVHARYSWTDDDGPKGRMRTGALALEAVELVRAGEHRLFSKQDHALIHSLIHVTVPSISMVVRTARGQGYMRFEPPSLCLTYEDLDQVIARQVALFDSLRAVADPRYVERLVDYLERADLETCFHLLKGAWPVADDESRGLLLTPVRRRHGERADELERALVQTVRIGQSYALRAQLRDPDDRLVATALLVAEKRDDVLSLLGEKHDDPIARLHRFVDEFGVALTGDEATAGATHRLVDGGGREAFVRHLGECFGEAEITGQLGQIERFLTESVFAPLT